MFHSTSDNGKGHTRQVKKTKYRQKIANNVALSIFDFSAHSVNVKYLLSDRFSNAFKCLSPAVVRLCGSCMGTHCTAVWPDSCMDGVWAHCTAVAWAGSVDPKVSPSHYHQSDTKWKHLLAVSNGNVRPHSPVVRRVTFGLFKVFRFCTR